MRRLGLAMTFCVLSALLSGVAGAQVTVSVDATKPVGTVPRALFGTNLRPDMQSTPEVLAFVRDIGISAFRYPDSVDGGYSWKWPEGVMMRGGKESLSPLGKLDGAIDFARKVGAELCFTVRIQGGATAEEAAEVVRQAKARGITGAYWCLGNEPYFTGTDTYFPREKYIALVRQFAPAIKAADPTARVGICWGGPYVNEESDPGRDEDILRATAELVDFADIHFYVGRPEKETDPWDPLKIVAAPELMKLWVPKFRNIVRQAAPAKAESFEINFWEWNGPPHPRVGGMQLLATAVMGADLLGVMAESGVTRACQYNLQEHYCGLIPGFQSEWEGTWPTQPWNGVTVRPLAYAIKLWAKHMGPTLIACTVTGSPTFEVHDWHTLANYQGAAPYIAAHATLSEDGKTLGLMLINKHPSDDQEVAVRLSGFTPKPEAVVRLLNGPDLLAHNDDEKAGYRSVPNPPEPKVTLTESRFGRAASTFTCTLPAHSVTQLDLAKE